MFNHDGIYRDINEVLGLIRTLTKAMGEMAERNEMIDKELLEMNEWILQQTKFLVELSAKFQSE